MSQVTAPLRVHFVVTPLLLPSTGMLAGVVLPIFLLAGCGNGAGNRYGSLHDAQPRHRVCAAQ